MAANKMDKRNELLKQMGSIDLQIMKLNEQMTEALQKAVDIDINVTGGVSDITKKFMEGFHYRINEQNRVVSEHEKWEYDQLPPIKEETQQVQQTKISPNDKRVITQDELDRLLSEHQKSHDEGNYEILDLSNCIFNDITFTGKMNDVDIRYSELNECSFRNVEMENSYLSNAEFMNTVFDNCAFDNSVFYGAEMGYCEMTDTRYTDCSFAKTAFVASKMNYSALSGCYMGEAVVSDTEFSNVLVNNCRGVESINFSGVNESMQASAENTFIHPEHTFRFELKSDNEAAVYVHSGQNVTEGIFQVDYNMDTHKIEKIKNINSLPADRSVLLERAGDMLRLDIQKEFQKRQLEKKGISSPCVMVKSSEAVGIKDNTMYDLKEFSNRLNFYGRDNIHRDTMYDKIDFTIAFDSGDGTGIQKWTDRYDLRTDKDNLIERLNNSRFFNTAQIKYLTDYIAGEVHQEEKTQPEPITVMTPKKTPVQAEQPGSIQERQHSTSLQVAQKKEKAQKGQHTVPAKYAALVYVQGKSDVKVRVTGSSPEKIIALCEKWNTERKADEQLGTAYMKQYNSETKSYDNIGKYKIKAGVELTPIYLELPPLGKEKFAQLVSDFKAKGVRYDPELKKWYVTQAYDLSLFADYLPKPSEAQIGVNTLEGEKNSVLGNLDRNKANLEGAGHQEKHKQEQNRKNDAPVL